MQLKERSANTRAPLETQVRIDIWYCLVMLWYCFGAFACTSAGSSSLGSRSVLQLARSITAEMSFFSARFIVGIHDVITPFSE
jgi:hypothetical protein